MIWIPSVLLLIALVLLVERTSKIWALEGHRERLREQLARGATIVDQTTNLLFQDFDRTLYYYRPLIHDRPAMERLAIQNLTEDLRIMSGFVGFGESNGWGHAFDVLAKHRVRTIVGRVVLSASASDEFNEALDQLVDRLRVFEMLRGFRAINVMRHAPYELSDDQFPDLQTAKAEVVSLQNKARKLMELVEQNHWKKVGQ